MNNRYSAPGVVGRGLADICKALSLIPCTGKKDTITFRYILFNSEKLILLDRGNGLKRKLTKPNL